MLLATQLSGLTPLLLLACPIGMGVMTLFMGKGMMGRHKGDAPTENASLAELRSEQLLLAEKIEALQNDESRTSTDSPPPHAA